MAWIVQTLEKKTADGNGAGIFHLTASSDESGVFHVGCDHEHRSADEAQTCKEALNHLGKMTGFPHEETIITVNGDSHAWPKTSITHEEICALAKQPVHASVTYEGPRHGDSRRSGLTHVGKSIKVENGLVIDCVVTGNA